MSHKNTLQEYCQKNKTNLPVYETHQTDQGFVSSVCLENFSARSREYPNKKSAEQDAAQKLLEKLSQNQNQVINVIGKCMVLIDGDHSAGVVAPLKQLDIDTKIFVSKSFQPPKDMPTDQLVYSRVAVKDAADVNLTIFATEIKEMYDKIVIVSRDAAFEELSLYLKEKWPETDVSICYDTKAVISEINRPIRSKTQ